MPTSSYIVTGLHGAAARTLNSRRCLRSVPEEHIVETGEDARRLAERMLRDKDRGAA